MISCESRDTIRSQTLDSLYETDWQWPIEVIMDKNSMSSEQYKKLSPTEKQVIASYKAMKTAVEHSPKWVVFMEDDLIFNKYIGHNIVNWEPIRNNFLNFGSLYTPNNNRCSEEDGNCWYKAECLKLYGSQFYIMSPHAAEWAINHWNDVIGLQDIKLTRLARGKPIYYHSPSLVQHRSVPSVWGGVSHQSGDFDYEWKNNQ